jgi:hypothetical protein
MDLGFDQADDVLGGMLQWFGKFEDRCQRWLLLTKLKNTDVGAPSASNPSCSWVNPAFRHSWRNTLPNATAGSKDSSYYWTNVA